MESRQNSEVISGKKIRIGKENNKKKIKKPEGIAKPTIKRLTENAGVKRISQDVYSESLKMIRMFSRIVMIDSLRLALMRGRKEVSDLDIVYALKKWDIEALGFDEI